MEFMLMFILYIVISLLIFISYLIGDGSKLHQGKLGRCIACLKRGFSCLQALLPSPVLGSISRCIDYVFYTRNSIFQLLYLAMTGAGHIILFIECLPYLIAFQPNASHATPAICYLTINILLFLMCSFCDPGVITRKNLKWYRNIYTKDGHLYEGGTECPTCFLPKPARSKHCTFSDKCYYKFDHFCLWTNNTIAALNHRWFTIFLASIVLMCLNATYMMISALHQISTANKLMDLQYLDQHGNAQAMNHRVLMQTLFMTFPRMFFLAVALPTLATLVFGFLCYHLYLVFTNQTTNERYKLRRLLPSKKAFCKQPYNRGIIRNIFEEFFPLRPHSKSR